MADGSVYYSPRETDQFILNPKMTQQVGQEYFPKPEQIIEKKMKLTNKQLKQIIKEELNKIFNENLEEFKLLQNSIDKILSGNKEEVSQAAEALKKAGHILQIEFNGSDEIILTFYRDTMTQRRQVTVYEMVKRKFNKMVSKGDVTINTHLQSKGLLDGFIGKTEYYFNDDYYYLTITFPGAHPDF